MDRDVSRPKPRRKLFERLRRWLGRRRRNAGPPRRERVSYAELQALDADVLAARLAEDPAAAAPYVEAAAVNGATGAMVLWGHMLLEGNGTPMDKPAALRWFNIAADAGDVEAVNMVGRCHERGWGTPPDAAAAAERYREAADRGHAWAQFNLAELLIQGLPPPADRRSALRYYVAAARQDHAKARNMLGRFREEGWLHAAHPAKAFAWYLAAARGGDFRGQFNTARLLAWQGRMDDALPWLRQAVETGIPEFCGEIAPDLRASADPRLRELGEIAQARAGGGLTPPAG